MTDPTTESTNPTPTPPPAAPPPTPPAAPAPAASTPLRKIPILAALLSLFPSAGNIYNGLYVRGITFFLLAAGSIYMAGERGEIWGLAIAFIWIFNVLDSWRQANLINYGYATDLGKSDPPRLPTGNGGLVGGAAIFLFGLIAAMELYLDFDIDWLFDLWPVYLMALGGWLVWSSIKARQASTGDDEL